MAFTAMFLIATAAMVGAWCGTRRLALAMLVVALIASVGTLLDHATDVLKLSF